MRMKLARNYNYNTHTDASQLRDIGSAPAPAPQDTNASLLLAKVQENQFGFLGYESAGGGFVCAGALNPLITPYMC